MSFEDKRKSWEDRFGILLSEMLQQQDERGVYIAPNPDPLINEFFAFVGQISALRIRYKYMANTED